MLLVLVNLSEDIMDWILRSDELPFGEVDANFWRWEFQDDVGSLHIHCLLSVADPASMSREEFGRSLLRRRRSIASIPRAGVHLTRAVELGAFLRRASLVRSTYTTARYVAKYIMKMDEKTAARVAFTSQGVFEVENGKIINTKISRNKRAKEQEDKREAQKGNMNDEDDADIEMEDVEPNMVEV